MECREEARTNRAHRVRSARAEGALTSISRPAGLPASRRRRLRSSAGGVRLVLALALALLAPIAADAATRLAGRVVDSETQRPIANARVELANASGGPGFYRDRTSGDGEFSIANVVTDRSYTLSVSADGYADFVLGWWQIPGAQRAAEIVIPLDRAGSIAVRLTRADGKAPIAAARVTVRTESPAPWWRGTRDEPGTQFTDRQGLARFPDLKTGPWTVQAEAAGLLPAEARRVLVRRGEETSIALRVFRPASLAGHVRLADGSGVADVTVMARGPAEGVGTTGPDGDFAIGDLPPGKYQVEVQHEGFGPARLAAPIDVTEGQTRDGLGLTVAPRPPELSFVLPREVFTPDERVEIAMRSFRLGQLDLSLHRVPIVALTDGARDFRRFAQGADTTGLERVRSWTHSFGEGAPFAWREEMLRVGQDLAPGVYVLRATAPGIERRQMFFVSDLSLLVKRSATKLLVSAASLKTGLPVERVAISAFKAQGFGLAGRSGGGWTQALGATATGVTAGVTGADGMMLAPLAGVSEAVRVIAISEEHGVAVAEAPLAPPVGQGGDVLYLYTERPIYRPGQTVYWKAFARKARGNGYALPDQGAVQLTMSGPEGASVDVPNALLSAHGSADGAIEIPPDLPLGDYVLRATAGRAVGAATFAIEAYRKPEFAVEVTPDREVVTSGDELRFQIGARYFFGAPVFGALVRYNLFETRLARDERALEDEDWESGDRVDAGFGRVLKTGETRTDIDGRAVLAFTPERVAYDRRLTLEVEVVDASNRRVRGRGSAIVGRGAFLVSARPENRLLMAGQPVVVLLATRDHLGKPVSASVTVTLDQDAWNPIERRFTRSTRPLASTTVTTDAAGRARVSLTPQPARSGNLTIRARAEDAKGNVITDETNVWVYDARTWQYAYRYPSLEAFPDRERYQPGDSARIVVNTDVGYAAVLATLEGRDLSEFRIVHLFGNTGLVTFPIRAEHAPNVYVSIHVRKGKEIVTRVLDLVVTGERHDLDIKLSADRATYRPRDEARVTIETRDRQGAPAPAEVSLGVVDEAIYQLRSDATPRAHEIFYGRRPNWVTTVVSFPAVYLGGASKSDREVRRDFRDVAFWAPAVVTGADGRAEVTFRFPDNLTTWRMTSRGATDDTKVGEAVARTLVTKDVVARLAPPRLLVAGDQASLVSVVTNRSGAPLPDVEESIEAQGAAIVSGEKSVRSSIPTGGESRSEWRIEAARDLSRADPDSVEAVFTFRARSAGDRDALEARVPVHPRAVPTRWAGGGVVENERQEIQVPLPPDLVRPGSEARIDVSPSPAAMALAAADALDENPWACTEQTANRVRPALALLAALGLGRPRPAGWQDAERRLAAPLARLAALQNQEGGWGWWGENETDPYLTALALDALGRAAASDLGGESVRNAIQRAQYPAIRAALEARTTDGQAYVLAHLIRVLPVFEPGTMEETGDGDSRMRREGAPGGAGSPGGSTTSRTTTNTPRALKRPAIRRAAAGASELRTRLEELATLVHASRDRLSAAGLALAARALSDLGRDAEAKAVLDLLMKQAVREGGGLHLPEAMDESRWFGEAEENTGYAISALLAIDPKDERARAMVEWLARRRTGRLWRSTRTTGPVAIALAEFLETHPGEVRPDYRLEVKWNGETLFDRAVGAADVFARPIALRVGARSLKPGENRLTVSRRGSGSVYVAWEATAYVPSPGPDSPAAPLTLTRTYLKAERTTDRRGRPQYLPNPLEPGQELAVGDLVMVRLTIAAKRPLEWLILEDPRPAGFEVEALQPEGVERPWNAHAEERDNAMAFFLDRVEAGETVIEYLYRPELEGRFTALPTSAAQMYDPDWIERGAEATLPVRGK
jgi:alpha-2-macroglobulin